MLKKLKTAMKNSICNLWNLKSGLFILLISCFHEGMLFANEYMSPPQRFLKNFYSHKAGNDGNSRCSSDDFCEAENKRFGFTSWGSYSQRQVYELHHQFLDAAMLSSTAQVYLRTYEPRPVKNIKSIQYLASIGMPIACDYLRIIAHLSFLEKERREKLEVKRIIEDALSRELPFIRESLF